VIKVGRRARQHEDRAGDPLDGLVNLFDVGIVLSVAFLLAALSSLNLTDALTGGAKENGQITVPQDEPVKPVPTDGQKVVGEGTKAGTVYRLKDGSLVYVVDGDATPLPSPTPGSLPTSIPTSVPTSTPTP
jgi:hypothetical protein